MPPCSRIREMLSLAVGTRKRSNLRLSRWVAWRLSADWHFGLPCRFTLRGLPRPTVLRFYFAAMHPSTRRRLLSNPRVSPPVIVQLRCSSGFRSRGACRGYGSPIVTARSYLPAGQHIWQGECHYFYGGLGERHPRAGSVLTVSVKPSSNGFRDVQSAGVWRHPETRAISRLHVRTIATRLPRLRRTAAQEKINAGGTAWHQDGADTPFLSCPNADTRHRPHLIIHERAPLVAGTSYSQCCWRR